MIRRILMHSAAALMLCIPAAAQTADEIVAKNMAARGGLSKLHAIQTMTIAGRLTGPGMDAPIRVHLKRPDSLRIDLDLQGKIMTQAYDGTIGWQINPFGPKPEAEQATGAELKKIQDQADLAGVLVDYKAKGHTVEFAGKSDVGGTPCYKLKIVLKTGTIMYQYLDAASYLEIREELIRTEDGKESIIEETVGDYKPVHGVLFAHAFDSNTKGSTDHYKLIMDKIELNQPVSAELFVMPRARTAN